MQSNLIWNLEKNEQCFSLIASFHPHAAEALSAAPIVLGVHEILSDTETAICGKSSANPAKVSSKCRLYFSSIVIIEFRGNVSK